jgi:hypothetical protein
MITVPGPAQPAAAGNQADAAAAVLAARLVGARAVTRSAHDVPVGEAGG